MKIKRFFRNNGYIIVKLIVTHLCMAIFGIMVYMPFSTENPTGKFFCLALGVCADFLCISHPYPDVGCRRQGQHRYSRRQAPQDAAQGFCARAYRGDTRYSSLRFVCHPVVLSRVFHGTEQSFHNGGLYHRALGGHVHGYQKRCFRQWFRVLFPHRAFCACSFCRAFISHRASSVEAFQACQKMIFSALPKGRAELIKTHTFSSLRIYISIRDILGDDILWQNAEGHLRRRSSAFFR